MSAVTLHYREHGAGAPLLVLHGLFGSGRNWQSVATELGHSHRVLLCDQRNHGESPRAPSMDYLSMARDVEHLLDTLGLARATILGHSMGGKVAMTLALEAPARVERLIVVDIAPLRRADRFGLLIGALQRLPLATLQNRAQADTALAGAIPDTALRAFLLHNLVRTAGGWAWRVDLAAIAANLEALLDFPAPALDARYRGPTLFVRGDRSDAVLDEHVNLIRGWFPSARIETIADAGHWLHAERRAEFLSCVQRFLAAT